MISCHASIQNYKAGSRNSRGLASLETAPFGGGGGGTVVPVHSFLPGGGGGGSGDRGLLRLPAASPLPSW